MKLFMLIVLLFTFPFCYAQTSFEYDQKGNMVAVKYTGKNACKVEDAIVNTAAVMRLFPNPTKNVLYVQTGSVDVLINRIKIFDAHGKLLIVKNYEAANILQVDVGSLLPSMYFIEFETTEKPVRMKFIKVR